MTETAETQTPGGKVYLETYGCQMNEYDSEIVRTILERSGFGIADSPEDAEVILLNTCSVREHAEQRVHARIATLRQLKRKNRGLVLGVLGCMAQSLKEELLEPGTGIDLIAGPDSYRALPVMIQQVRDGGGSEFALTLSDYETYSDIFPTSRQGTNAWVAVMRGCDNFCTFCVVPLTRGRERSRDPYNVVEEVSQLAEQGFKQVTLLGQNVNSYESNGFDFARLITEVSKIEGLRRIRFTSPHPKDFPESLIEVVASNPKACKHIHLPLQAGSDRILEKMNRTYTRDEYIALARKMRDRIPGLAITTDIIVGFPTETEAEFLDTLDLMRQVEFDAAFMFKYSERKGTTAQKRYRDDVSDDDKTSRMIRLVELQRQLSLSRNQAHLGEVFEVMVEGRAKKAGQLMGRNDANKTVVFADNGAQAGDFVKVEVNEVTPNTLIGAAV